MDSLAQTSDITPSGTADAGTEPVMEDLLVEDVSIDGMCGVY
jgi:mycofactocin precursor